MRRGSGVCRARCFNTCSSCEEQLGRGFRLSPETGFQYMLLLRGATYSGWRRRTCGEFQYMLLLRGATDPVMEEFWNIYVSIHAPLARSNGIPAITSMEEPFQYMLLLRGATIKPDNRGRNKKFQYMLLLRGATPPCKIHVLRNIVSIHAPLARSNAREAERRRREELVSIHAPLARSNW